MKISFLRKTIELIKSTYLLMNRVKLLFCIYRNRDYKFELDEQFVSRMYPGIFPLHRSVYKSCVEKNDALRNSAAVIFNSSLENFVQKGSEIDHHDIVIRINFGTGTLKPDFLGRKTTIRVLGRDWIYWDGNEICGRTYNVNKYYQSDKSNLSVSPQIFPGGLFIFDNEKMEFFRGLLGGMMSNGMRSVLLGLSLAERVYIYGADSPSGLLGTAPVGDSRHYPNGALEDYFIKWSEDRGISNDIDRYFGNLHKPSHKLALEYFFYRWHPRVFMI